MLSVVKMLLKGEVGGHALNSPTVYRRVYLCKFMTLSNQPLRYICKCIRISDHIHDKKYLFAEIWQGKNGQLTWLRLTKKCCQ